MMADRTRSQPVPINRQHIEDIPANREPVERIVACRRNLRLPGATDARAGTEFDHATSSAAWARDSSNV